MFRYKSLQKELNRLSEQLEPQTTEKRILEALIGHVHAKIEILK